MATDKQLIGQIRKGDSEAYGQLFSKYYQQIYSVCQQMVRNPHDAEEVTSETFVHAYLKLNQLKKPDKFYLWLKKIARNCSRDFLRGKQKDTIPLSLATEQASTQASPDKSILKQELIEAVMEAVSALPPKDREVVRAYIDGLNHTEISERLDISAQASMNRLHRARKKIKARVKDLLNAIIGLPNTLPLKKIISGGITAMKLGTSTKISIGVIIAAISGFIGFQVWLHQEAQQSEVKSLSTKQATRTVPQPTVHESSSESGESIQDEQYSQRGLNSFTIEGTF